MRHPRLIALLAGAITFLGCIAIAAYVLLLDAGALSKVLARQAAPEVARESGRHGNHAGEEEHGAGEHAGEAGARHEEYPGHDELGADVHAGEEGTGHDEHAGHRDGMVRLSKAKMDDLDLAVGTVHAGTVQSTVSIPAETMLDPDDKAHVVPWMSGITREVFVSIGDQVTKGDLLAVVDSRELGSAKSDYLANLSRLDLARSTFEREKQLWEDKISAEQDYLEARQAYRAAQIEVDAAKQALFALGVTAERVASLPGERGGPLTRYEIRAPFDGTVIERHVTPGEAIDSDSEIFLIASLDSVWVMGRLPERDLRRVSVGQEATIQFDAFPGEEFTAKVDYIGNVLDPRSRTVSARVVLPNPGERIRAGMFGRMLVFSASHDHAETLLVPNEALQRTDDGALVYRQKQEGVFEPVPVEVLHASNSHTEVKGPLAEGDAIVVNNVFILKSEAGKEAMGGGHSH